MCARYLMLLETLGYPLSPIEAHVVRGIGRYTPIEMEGTTPPGGAPAASGPGAASGSHPGGESPVDEEGRFCILTGMPGEDPDDHGTHAHEYDPATQDEPGHDQPGIHGRVTEPATGSAAYAGDDAESLVG
jgi:hypothetical protein